jgi:PAS domain S-box-containing protein
MKPENGTLLLGWNKISAYLNCSVSSARRRAKEGLPIFRVGGSVRAYAAEIDRWIHPPGASAAASPEGGGEAAARPSAEPPPPNMVERDGRLYALVPVEDRKSSKLSGNDALDTLPAWIWEIDADGRFSYSNAVVTKILGRDADEILGRTPAEAGALADDLPELERVLDLSRREGTTVKGFECRFERNDSQRRRIMIYAEPTFNAAGDFVGFRGVSCDVTEGRVPATYPPLDR